jgi:alcohol dehydrogenase (cytochrome c)
MRSLAFLLLVPGALWPVALWAQGAPVTFERLLHADAEPQNWLTYSGNYNSQRYSTLSQIDRSNVAGVELKWVYQIESLQKAETSPLVVGGVMYLTQAPNDVVALDARSGRAFWIYQYKPASGYKLCCGTVNRGLAILGDTLFMGTVDGHLIAIDARSGRPLWNKTVADYTASYAIVLAPLVIKDKVLIGVAGGEFGVRGFIAAYDAKTGNEDWRFNTVPGTGEPGVESWQGDSWKHGGGPIWVTGSYDPDLNLTYWGVGNPGPDWGPGQRMGDNLYTDSVVALDPDSGQLRWYFQFTPHDSMDFDSVQIPVLIDADWNGRPRKLMAWGNRNGFFYTLDRSNGQFLGGHPFVKVNWASGLDPKGRPIETPQPAGQPTYPGNQGGTNWYSPSYSPRTHLFYLSAWENYASVLMFAPAEYRAGQQFTGGRAAPPILGAANPSVRVPPILNYTDDLGRGAIIALDLNGAQRWKFETTAVTDGGILTTASDLLFTGGREGFFYALDARNGAPLWKAPVGGPISAAPITYQLDGRQYVAIAAGHALFVYGLKH